MQPMMQLRQWWGKKEKLSFAHQFIKSEFFLKKLKQQQQLLQTLQKSKITEKMKIIKKISDQHQWLLHLFVRLTYHKNWRNCLNYWSCQTYKITNWWIWSIANISTIWINNTVSATQTTIHSHDSLNSEKVISGMNALSLKFHIIFGYLMWNNERS